MSGRLRRLDDGRLVHQTEWLAVREYYVERRDVVARYPVVERPDSISAIPLMPTRRTVLLQQFRFPTNERSWELRIGGISGGEPAEVAARWELLEEVGVHAKDLVRIGDFCPVPGLCAQRVTVFVVGAAEEELGAAIASWSTSEEIQGISTVHLTDLAAMIADGA